MCIEVLLLELGHGHQHLCVEVRLRFAVDRRTAGTTPGKLLRRDACDLREVLVGQLVALVVAVPPQQRLEQNGDVLVPLLARHVAEGVPLLRPGGKPIRQIVQHLMPAPWSS